MSEANTSHMPILQAAPGAQSAPHHQPRNDGGETRAPFPPYSSLYRGILYGNLKLIEYQYTEEGSTPKPTRFTPELNVAASKLREGLYDIWDRVNAGKSPLFSRVEGIGHNVVIACDYFDEFIRNCQTTDFEDESIKTSIEEIVPKLLKHVEMVARNVPKPGLTGVDSLKDLYEQVEEAERDPAMWEVVKKTLLKAKTPNAYWLATSFITPYDKLDHINRRLRFDADKVQLAESEIELTRIEKLMDVKGRKSRSEEEKKWAAEELKQHPEIAKQMAEGRDFYQKHLQGAASEQEVEAYYDDHPFGFTDKADMEICLKVLSEVLSENEA